jgi:hypothetical protein
MVKGFLESLNGYFEIRHCSRSSVPVRGIQSQDPEVDLPSLDDHLAFHRRLPSIVEWPFRDPPLLLFFGTCRGIQPQDREVGLQGPHTCISTFNSVPQLFLRGLG